ncbi:MAG: TonB-dependent receptor [Planctomycetes bacterium]|nr:TonB-dependent receptor [Planctomycetota bacterium]
MRWFGYCAQAWIAVVLCGIVPFSATHAQEEPVPAMVTVHLQDESPPELPETVVVGRPGNFPGSPLGEDEILSANRTPTSISDTGSSYTVITREAIDRRQQPMVADVLRGTLGVDVTRQGGLDVVRQGGAGSNTSVFLRGANSQHTKVLLDGIPINDPSNPTRGFDFSSLSVDNIERIEILRGPQSVLYGSDPIGGVINIVTLRGDGPTRIRAGAMGGSFGTSQEYFSASGGNERTYFSLSGSYFNTNGISQGNVARGNSERDGFRNGTIGGRVGWNPSESWNVDYVFRYNDARLEIDDFNFGPGAPVIDNLTRANLSHSFLNRIQIQNSAWDDLVRHKVGFSLTDYDRRDTDPGFPGVPAQFLGQTREVDYQFNIQISAENEFTAGASYLQEEGHTLRDALTLDRASQNDAAVYLQDRMTFFERWTHTIGARWDDYNRAGPAQTYRYTSLLKLFDEQTSLHGSIGTGFRAPALAELLFQFGNPALRPETSKGWDVGIERRWLDDLIVTDLTFFRNDFQNLIVFDLNSFTLQNVGQARASGVEFSSALRLTDSTSLTGNYTFTDTVNLDSGTALLRRPRDKAGIGLDHRFNEQRTTLGLYAILVGPRFDTSAAGNVSLPRYTLLNLTGRHQWREHCELFARLDNVLNSHYEEVLGFGTPGFSAFGGVNLFW